MSPESILQSDIGRRTTCNESSVSLMIQIVTPKRYEFLAVLLVIFVGWKLLFSNTEIMISNFDPTLFICGIGVFLFPIYALLWNLIGKEIITVTKNDLVIKQDVLGMGFQQTYRLPQVRNLRGALADPAPFTLEKNMQDWGFAGGSVAFDYNGKTCRFGLLLPMEDADRLAERINKFLIDSSVNSLPPSHQHSSIL